MANHGSRRASRTELGSLTKGLWSMECGLYLPVFLTAVFASLLLCCEGQVNGNDTGGLMAFKDAADPSGVLNQSWISGTSPCGSESTSPWLGIRCNDRERVDSVQLPGLQLTGIFEERSLSKLNELRYLILANNSLSGSLPGDLANLTGLLQFWAQNNKFSGPFPNLCERIGMVDLSGNDLNDQLPDLTRLTNLTILDVSGNNLHGDLGPLPTNLRSLNLSGNSLLGGSIPPELLDLKNLTVLDLSGNRFNSAIPTLASSLQTLNLGDNSLTGIIPTYLSGLMNLSVLDLSHNQLQGYIPALPSSVETLGLADNLLTGDIPPTLAQNFPLSSFAGNAGLCGPPTTTVCPAPTPAPALATVEKPAKKLTPLQVCIISAGSLTLILTIVCSAGYYFARRVKPGGKPGDKKTNDSGGKSSSVEEAEEVKLAFVDEDRYSYDLEDLLRASAEMLGKGSLGTVYKAVMENGLVVVVKRVKDVRDMGWKEFNAHMETLGKLRHPNLVPLRAYYFTSDERLLIYDFMPNGSLFSLLHGARGPGRRPLEWSSRLNIALGVAQGLTFLHRECPSLNSPHGNLKSTNVLLDKNFEVKIGDFGVAQLMTTATAARRMVGYRAPEYRNAKRITHKADVYSFGVLLLELLTGRQPALLGESEGIDLPRWVQSVVKEEWTGEVFDLELKTYLHGEEEMVSLLQIAMTCVMSLPEKRPDMAEVLDMIQAIRPVESYSESYESHSNSSDGENLSQEDTSNVPEDGQPAGVNLPTSQMEKDNEDRPT